MAKRQRLPAIKPETQAISGRKGLPGLAGPAGPTLDSAPYVAPAGPLGPSTEALALFEVGMGALQRHSYGEASDRFRTLLERFPGEKALRDRSQVYIELCARELNHRPTPPQTVEERLTAATAALNNDDDDTAERLIRAVLDEVPEHDLALYLMAAIEARRGEVEAALQFLGDAIRQSPDVRAQARHDADFDNLRHLDAFRQLMEVAPGSGPRRTRRARPER